MALSYTKETVEELDNIFAATELCDDNKIDYGELETVEELKKLLLDRLEASKSEDNRTKMQDRFKEITQADAEQRNQLLQIYTALLAFFKLEGCDVKVKENINQQVRNCEEQIMEHYDKLQKDGCPVLVTGETGAGKSSFLNLLLGSDILPVDHALCATSTICELHNSDKHEATIYYGKAHDDMKDGKKSQSCKTESLPPDNMQKVQDVLKKYANIVDRRGDIDKYDLIRIDWPIPMLQGNVYLVDSPGVGESTEMNKKVMQYLPKAAAFIYIINSSINGGGLSENRLELILKQISGRQGDEKLQHFHPRSAIFIFNKWDDVPEESKAGVKKRNIKKLKKMWSGLDEDRQVFYLSVRQARRLLQSNAGETEEYKRLLDGIYEFMEIGLKLVIRDHRGWLEYIHGRITNTVQTRVTSAKRSNEERMRISEHIKQKLDRLLNQSDKIIARLEQNLEKETMMIVTKLDGHLSKKETQERLARHCCEQEIPDEEDMDKNKFICKDLIREAMFKDVADWESETKTIEDTKTRLFNEFKRKFAQVDDELQQIERLMQGACSIPQTSSSGGMMDDMPEDGPLFSPAEKLVLGLTSPIWLPLALIASAIALPIMGSLAVRDRIVNDRKLISYRENKYKYVLQWTRQVIEALKPDDIRKTFVQNEMSSLAEYIIKFKNIIPELVEADRKLIEEVERDITTTYDILKQYCPLLEQIHKSHGRLQLFGFRNLLREEPNVYNEDQIKLEEIIGHGGFADVYIVKLHREDLPDERCAAKVMKSPLNEDNARLIAMEREILIKLDHENVIRYIGTILDRDERLILLLDLCKCTLASVIFQDTDKNPGRQTDVEKRQKAFEYIADKAQQIARGLLYIHRLNYVHQDLKTENILLTEEGTVKLSDFGQANVIKMGDQTVTLTSAIQWGTVGYLDPDILEGGLPTRETDIYSFAMVLWELWFGMHVYSDLLEARSMKPDKLLQDISKGLRPTFDMNGFVSPIPEWRDLIEWCWKPKPRERKNTKQVHDILCRLSKKEVPQIEESAPLPEVEPGPVSIANMYQYTSSLTSVDSLKRVTPQPIIEKVQYERVMGNSDDEDESPPAS